MAEDLSARIEAYFRRRADDRILAVYLYGSRARGTASRDSDVDVAVVLDPAPPIAPEARMDLRLQLIGDAIHVTGENEVDLVILNDVPAPMASRIIREGVRIHATGPERLHAFERDVQLRAADLEPFLRRARRVQLERLAR
jgi:predicted nucleotidyltransferase